MNDMSRTQNILEVENLTTYFDIKEGLLRRTIARVHAVESVSFAIRPGETLSIVGESGCGKTTTGRTIIGLEQATAGDVRFQGRSATSFGKKDRLDFYTSVQMIFQDPYSSLNPRMSVREILSEPIRVHNLVPKDQIDARVADLLRKVNLPAEFASRYPHEFSGGQRQRVSIARALAMNPKVIICDEAVSALDVTIKAQVINLLMDLQQELGLAYLFISHDMAVVERISHRVAVMCLGQIVEIGNREQIFENPSHSYTRKLLGAVPVADPRLRRKDRSLMVDEIPSPVKPMTYRPQLVSYDEIAPGHLVARE